MIVEFVGLSGSGKTTVARAVLAETDSLAWGRRSLSPDPAALNARMLVQAALGAVTVPLLAVRMVIDATARSYWRRIGVRRCLEILFMAARNRAQSGSSEVFVLDQGVVQSLAYRVRKWPEEEQDRALPVLYRCLGIRCVPDVIVEFTVPPDVAVARSKLDDPFHGDPQRAAHLAVAIHAAATAAARTLGVTVLRTTNEAAAHVTARDLVSTLDRVSGSPA